MSRLMAQIIHRQRVNFRINFGRYGLGFVLRKDSKQVTLNFAFFFDPLSHQILFCWQNISSTFSKVQRCIETLPLAVSEKSSISSYPDGDKKFQSSFPHEIVCLELTYLEHSIRILDKNVEIISLSDATCNSAVYFLLRHEFGCCHLTGL